MDWNLDHIAWARRLKLRHLEIFLTLASAGSVTAAARLMHMTQPAVSHWLSDIEDLVGTPLFLRNRGLRLTEAGEVLARHARRMLGDLRRTSEEIESVKSGIAGRSCTWAPCCRPAGAAAARHRGLAARVPRHLRGSG